MANWPYLKEDHFSGGWPVLETARALIDRVVLRPMGPDGGIEIELEGDLPALLRLGMAGVDARRPDAAVPSMFLSSTKVVAGTRNRRSHHSTVPI